MTHPRPLPRAPHRRYVNRVRDPTLFGTLVLLTALAPTRALACATCGCGDPTLTTMGAEPPFAGRLRMSARLRYRWDSLGAGESTRTELHEGVLALGASWAPTDWLVVSGEAPLVLRDVRWANLARTVTLGPGDAEIRARAVVLRDRRFAPSHLLGVQAGVKLPTSLDQVGADGRRLPMHAQTGTGTVDPLAGLFYAHFADPWALFGTATVALPISGRFEEAPGPSLRATAALQYRLNRWITLRGGVDVRWDAPARVGERTDPDTEHVTLFLSPDVLWAPVSDLVLSLGLRAPVAQHSGLGRTEGLYVVTSMVVDV